MVSEHESFLQEILTIGSLKVSGTCDEPQTFSCNPSDGSSSNYTPLSPQMFDAKSILSCVNHPKFETDSKDLRYLDLKLKNKQMEKFLPGIDDLKLSSTLLTRRPSRVSSSSCSSSSKNETPDPNDSNDEVQDIYTSDLSAVESDDVSLSSGGSSSYPSSPRKRNGQPFAFNGRKISQSRGRMPLPFSSLGDWRAKLQNVLNEDDLGNLESQNCNSPRVNLSAFDEHFTSFFSTSTHPSLKTVNCKCTFQKINNNSTSGSQHRKLRTNTNPNSEVSGNCGVQNSKSSSKVKKFSPSALISPSSSDGQGGFSDSASDRDLTDLNRIRTRDLKYMGLPMGPLCVESPFVSSDCNSFGGSLYEDRGPSPVFCGIGAKYRDWRKRLRLLLSERKHQCPQDENRDVQSWERFPMLGNGNYADRNLGLENRERCTRGLRSQRTINPFYCGLFEGILSPESSSGEETELQAALLASLEAKRPNSSNLKERHPFLEPAFEEVNQGKIQTKPSCIENPELLSDVVKSTSRAAVSDPCTTSTRPSTTASGRTRARVIDLLMGLEPSNTEKLCSKSSSSDAIKPEKILASKKDEISMKILQNLAKLSQLRKSKSRSREGNASVQREKNVAAEKKFCLLPGPSSAFSGNFCSDAHFGRRTTTTNANPLEATDFRVPGSSSHFKGSSHLKKGDALLNFTSSCYETELGFAKHRSPFSPLRRLQEGDALVASINGGLDEDFALLKAMEESSKGALGAGELPAPSAGLQNNFFWGSR